MGNACCSSESEDQFMDAFMINYPDYKEIPEIIVGIGVKATASWEAKITRAQLRELREEFWKTRTEGVKLTWIIIRSMIRSDPDKALNMIQQLNYKIKNGNLTLIQDSVYIYYKIPIFMINDPIAFHEEEGAELREVKKTEEIIKVMIRRVGVINDTNIELKNTSKVSDLKSLYSEATSLRYETIKLFFCGKEIEDQETLANNFIENGMVVQAF